MNSETIYEYYLRQKDFNSMDLEQKRKCVDWNERLRKELIRAVDENKKNYKFCRIIQNKHYRRVNQLDDYNNDYTKFEIIDPFLLEISKYVKEQGLNYDLDIGSRTYANSTIYDDNGVFRIYW